MLRQQHGLRTAETVTCPTLDQGFRGVVCIVLGVFMRLSLIEKKAIIDLLRDPDSNKRPAGCSNAEYADDELIDIFLRHYTLADPIINSLVGETGSRWRTQRDHSIYLGGFSTSDQASYPSRPGF